MRGLMAGTSIDLYTQKCNKLTNNQYIMAEVKDGRYLIAKDIPLDPKGETVIKKGREIYLPTVCSILTASFWVPIISMISGNFSRMRLRMVGTTLYQRTQRWVSQLSSKKSHR